MLPNIEPGDLVCIKKQKESDYSIGEIIIYMFNGKLIAHRIINKCSIGV